MHGAALLGDTHAFEQGLGAASVFTNALAFKVDYVVNLKQESCILFL
jgi:hypothetical protein